MGPEAGGAIAFHRPGMLFIPPRLDDGVRRIVAEMRRIGIGVSILSAAEVAERFPFLDVASHHSPRRPDDPSFLEPTGRTIEGAVLEEDAGYVVSPGLATRSLREAAERAGARFLLRREVVGIERSGPRRFRLALEGGAPVEADVVVNAAGPHSSRVNGLAGVALPLRTRPLRREVHALANPLFAAGRGPCLPVVGDLDAGVYCRPEAGGRDLIVGTVDPECDELEWVEDPDDFRREVTEPYWRRQCLRLMQRLPEARLEPPRGIAALYDVTVADWYPIVDRTDVPGYYVAIGTSGSSFKTAPVLGRLLAEVIEACEGGRDTDRDPIELRLPRAGVTVDVRFLSRLRGRMGSTRTVIG
ncbi:MAG: FAD-binding oxidoreductase [Planctomycetes bacterium]|nr:FAD-binding oxidoreductase [Planctomycetota bacterium]